MSLMVIHPSHCSSDDLKDLLKALPPSSGEHLQDWLERTGNELEGDPLQLDVLFADAWVGLNKDHFINRQAPLDFTFGRFYRCDCSCGCKGRHSHPTSSYCRDCREGDC